MKERPRRPPAAPAAIGLRHDRESAGAPRVVAKGKGELAERILALASEHGVPIREDPDLLELLAASELGDEIPVEVYEVVARLIAFLYRANGTAGCD